MIDQETLDEIIYATINEFTDFWHLYHLSGIAENTKIHDNVVKSLGMDNEE